jgi:hypothetical protein
MFIHTIGKPNNSLEQPSSDTFSQTIGKPNNSLEQPSADTFSQTIGKPNNSLEHLHQIRSVKRLENQIIH